MRSTIGPLFAFTLIYDLLIDVMNRADEIRDQIRQMRYLVEEKRFIDDMIRKLEDQRNRLQLEEHSIRKMAQTEHNTGTALNRESPEEEVTETTTQEEVDSSDSNYFSSGTPSRPIEEPIVDCLPFNDDMNGCKKPKAVAETIELDVSKVLLRLAFGGNQDMEEVDEEDNDY